LEGQKHDRGGESDTGEDVDDAFVGTFFLFFLSLE
jgi:hypothetical protein